MRPASYDAKMRPAKSVLSRTRARPIAGVDYVVGVTAWWRYRLSAARSKVLGIRPWSPDPYATHVPVLIGIAKTTEIKRVLELGSGPYSTSLFLDRSVFPHLEQLVSHEDDVEWKSVVLEEVGADPRLDFRMVPAVNASVPDDLSGFDLIFVDDSREIPERARTIASVLAKRPSGLVVIHDFQFRQYRSAARSYRHRHVFSAFTPQTGLIDHSRKLGRDQVGRLDRALEQGRDAGAELRDLETWSAVFDAAGLRTSK